jgi:thioredoxin-like negative regulator of GroEL
METPENKKISVYVFSSPTCEPCKVLKPVFNELKEEYSDFEWNFTDITNDPQNVKDFFNVSKIPSMVIEKDGSVVSRCQGTVVTQYLSCLRTASRLLPRLQ